MELKECYIGQIICASSKREKIGYIVDLTVNSTREVILVVKWADNEWGMENPEPIHPSNVSPLKY